MADNLINLTRKYRIELYLLMFENIGTPLESFISKYMNEQIKFGKETIATLRNMYSNLDSNISPLFIRVNIGMWFMILKLLISDESITDEQIRHLVANYVTFGTGGWMRLLGVK